MVIGADAMRTLVVVMMTTVMRDRTWLLQILHQGVQPQPAIISTPKSQDPAPAMHRPGSKRVECAQATATGA